MERKLASIQRVLSVEPIENADSIEKVNVLGWHCVAKKGEFKSGSLCIYCEVDSVMPDKPEFEFLKDRGFRIRTIKLRGQVSQGICFPTDILPSPIELKEGDDVTELIGVIKYEKPIPLSLSGQVEGYFPGFIPKTDEVRIQTVPDVLVRNKGQECYMTEKVDGCSITVWLHNGDFGVASRNLRYKDTDGNIWWVTAKRLGVESKLRNLGRNIALQGELLGNVQGNKYKLTQPTVKWFNAYDIDNQSHLTYIDFSNLITQLGLDTVPMLGLIALSHTSDELVELSKGKSKLADIHREGVVFRTTTKVVDLELGRLSFKVVNPDFLLKYNE